MSGVQGGRWRVCRGCAGRFRRLFPADRSTSGGPGQVVVGSRQAIPCPNPPRPVPPHGPNPRPQPTGPDHDLPQPTGSGPRPALCVGADMVPSDPFHGLTSEMVGWRPGIQYGNPPSRRQPTKCAPGPPTTWRGADPPTTKRRRARQPRRVPGKPVRPVVSQMTYRPSHHPHIKQKSRSTPHREARVGSTFGGSRDQVSLLR